uniref:RL domain-containing protein n=1 Tax=Takifugu rubripes TaxID=31033 RepID=A0A674PD98_TAKRU
CLVFSALDWGISMINQSALQEERFQQAERSVLIGYHSRINEQTFLKNLSRHGDIKKYFFYESYVCNPQNISDRGICHIGSSKLMVWVCLCHAGSICFGGIH